MNFAGIACSAVPLVIGAAGDSESTAECTFTAGDPSTIVYDIFYTPGVLAPFAPSDTDAEVVIQRTLPATGPGNIPIFAGGALMLLLVGGTLFVSRRRAEAS